MISIPDEKVLLRRIPSKGLIITEEFHPTESIVVQVGVGADINVEPGDRVVHKPNAGEVYRVDGEDLLVMEQDWVLARVD